MTFSRDSVRVRLFLFTWRASDRKPAGVFPVLQMVAEQSYCTTLTGGGDQEEVAAEEEPAVAEEEE